MATIFSIEALLRPGEWQDATLKEDNNPTAQITQQIFIQNMKKKSKQVKKENFERRFSTNKLSKSREREELYQFKIIK